MVERHHDSALPDGESLPAAEPVAASAVTAPPPSATLDAENWADIVTGLELNGMARQFALNCAYKGREGNVVELQLAATHAQLQNGAFQERLEESLSSYYGEPLKLRIEVIAEAGIETPSQVESRRQAERQQAAQQAIENDPIVRALVEQFDAQIQMNSIQPKV